MSRNFYYVGIAFFRMVNGLFNQLALLFALIHVQILSPALLFGSTGLFFSATLGFRLEFGGDLRVVLRAQIHLLDGGAVVFGVGLEALLALEGLDLLDGHFQLVCDPRIGTTLSHPPADLVKLRTQGPAAHKRPGD